ncbi:LysR family transcriptional regulator [Pseudomonas aeruginosa]|nr:LysR family transcriptional regulator [Pseudomonas aeruginosa]
MKLHQLQALVASADAGGIRAAARVLGISQAAVTRALRANWKPNSICRCSSARPAA